MHVLVPIARRSTYAQAREFGEIVARTLASTHRGLVTTEWVKRKRRGVLIDANQNGEGKTIASAYSVRPRPGAPVSTPLRWDEVKAGLDPPTSRWTSSCGAWRRTATCSQACSRVGNPWRRRSRLSASGVPYDSPSRRGWPRVPSSAMSRRKKSATVQSATTRSLREKSGSWLRWYVRVTNQPGKPRRRRPSTSAIPL